MRLPNLHIPFLVAGTLLLAGCVSSVFAATKTKKETKKAAPPLLAVVQPISYNFQIRPLLANSCFRCHGPDEKAREAKLRLDSPEAAYETAIRPGDADGSEMVKRLFSTDPDEVMPPPDSHLELKPGERELLRKWIAEGAKYDTHWSFKPLEKPPLPSSAAKNPWVRQDLDAFVLEQLNARKIKPAEPATKERWIRRVTMDLTGLPPTLAEIDSFAVDASPAAHQTVVDRLLESPRYGERMALDWLDAARYADTYGRHEDGDSENFPYRDWAIRVFNQNLPYDKFIEWQIGGDMLPNPTLDMQLATAFNRLHQQSNESGSDEEEFRCEHVADRVKTTATAFLGLTMECARCHDHKYDPISIREYYAFGAFLNNIDELGLFSRFTNATPTPAMFLYEGDQEARHQELLGKIAAQQSAIKALESAAKERFAAWLAAGNKPGCAQPTDLLPFEGKLKAGDMPNSADPSRPGSFKFKINTVTGPAGNALLLEGDQKINWGKVGDFHRSDAFTISMWLKPAEVQKRAVLLHHTVGADDAGCRGYELLLDEMRPDFCLAHFWPGNGIRIRARHPLAIGAWSHVTAVYDGSSKASGMHLYLNGVEMEVDIIGDNLTKDLRYEFESGDLNVKKIADAGISATVDVEIGGRRNDAGLINACVDEIQIFDRALTAPEARTIAGQDASKDDWFGWYLRDVDAPAMALNKSLHALREEECDFTKGVREMMIMKESPGKRRETFVLTRGQFNERGQRVEPDVPASIFPWPDELPRDRGGLAKWFTDPRNPLTARVAVNRIWQMFFGKGLVPTPEDFGIQGGLPSHPELLDWLACDFRDQGWDVKRFCRMIVLSATYRQSSKPSDARVLTEDPDNRLLARGSHHRWSAEMIRDQALAVSGLLVEKLGGPSVFPYQPAKLWDESGIQHTYNQDSGEKLYRRSMYTFWRRTLPPPSMTIFDAPSREYCRMRREITSTPLQALSLMNDPQMVEAARVAAEKWLRLHPKNTGQQLFDSFRALTGRKPSEKEVAALQQLYTDSLLRYQSDPQAATELLTKNGESPVVGGLDPTEVAAMTMVQRMLLSHQETVLKY